MLMFELNAPWPSRKNGLRSLKNDSKPDRFTCDGSASTCPKSGLIVASSVRFEVSPYLRSAPTRDWLRWSNFPAVVDGTLAVCATEYGENSARRGDTMPLMPVTSPNFEAIPLDARS